MTRYTCGFFPRILAITPATRYTCVFLSRILAFYSQVYDHFLTNAHIYAHKKVHIYALQTSMWYITPRQNVYACARLSISGLFFSHTFQSDQSLPRALGFILCAACGSVVLLYAARVFDYFVVIEIAFMDNQAQITETISRLDLEKVRW